MTGVDSDVQNALADQEKEMSEEAKKAARTLCKTIENHLTCHLEEKGIENERELAALLIDGLSSCKEALNASKVEGASMMTVVGKKDPVTRKVSCMAASVGDLSLRILRKNGDVEKMNARTWAATSFARPSDSGGSITPLRMDLRNLELIRFELEEGDTLLMNTDGPEDNLDPQMLGLTPAQAAQMVNYRDNYAADVPWSSGHADLKEAYKEKMLHKMLDRPQPITQTLIAHSYTDGVKRDHDSAQQYSLRFEVA
jgi:hypothetical protein